MRVAYFEEVGNAGLVHVDVGMRGIFRLIDILAQFTAQEVGSKQGRTILRCN